MNQQHATATPTRVKALTRPEAWLLANFSGLLAAIDALHAAHAQEHGPDDCFCCLDLHTFRHMCQTYYDSCKSSLGV